MSEFNNINNIPEFHINIDSFSEIKSSVKEFFSKIKNFLLDLTKTNKNINDNINNKLDDRVFLFSYPLLEISCSLDNFGLEDEAFQLSYIQSMGNFILKDSELFSKYSYFITDLLDLFADLISHLDDEDYKEHYDEFNTKFNEFEKFFLTEIYYSADEDREKVFMLTRELWG